jgi:hypothetical protein
MLEHVLKATEARDWRRLMFSWQSTDIVQLKCDGTRWRTGGEVKGKLANGVDSQYSSHYHGIWCMQHYYHWCAHLGLPVVDWTDATDDLNRLVRFAERRNLVSARVPSHFKRSLTEHKEPEIIPAAGLGRGLVCLVRCRETTGLLLAGGIDSSATTHREIQALQVACSERVLCANTFSYPDM